MLVTVQVVECSGNLGQGLDHVIEAKTGSALGLEALLEVGAVDPVHDHAVAVAVEEVLPHERQQAVRPDAEEDARLAQHRGAVLVRLAGPDLHRDHAVVDPVEGPDHLTLPAAPDQLQHLVAVPKELHGDYRASGGRRSASATAPRRTASFASSTRRDCRRS